MEDSLVTRRSKRSTAGNRMEAALAEFKAEDLGMDVEEDADFALGKEEEDVFESDFESTDEEGAQEDVDDAAEKLIRQEELRVRKTTRTHLERVTALAHARQAATFNPSTIAPPPADKQKVQKKLSRRVSLGIAVDAETGEVVEAAGEAEDIAASVAVLTPGGRRHSTRTHTVANTSATVSRVRDEVRKQSSAPKRARTKIKAPTQEELMARALDMEEGNIEQHKNYLTLEEEKRRKAQVVRTSVQGPLIRWVSKKEEVTVLVQPPPPPTPPAPPSTRPAANPYIHYQYPPPPTSGGTSPQEPRPSPYTQTTSQHMPSQYTPQQYSPPQYPPSQHQQALAQYSATQSQSPSVPSSSSILSSIPTPSAPFQQWPPPPERSSWFHPSSSTASTAAGAASIAAPTPPYTSSPYVPTTTASTWIPPTPAPPAPSRPIERKETVAKQYVVHEVEQTEKAPRPKWNSTMTAMFGGHADWENMRVYTTKGRPFTRPTQICPITGKIAKYLDPRTNVPYADLTAYRVLSAILRHEHVWSHRLGCYVSQEGSVFTQASS